MAQLLLLLTIVFASTAAQAQGGRVFYSTDCRHSNVPCNTGPDQSVLEALRLPDGSPARRHAEMCVLLPSSEQGACMAQRREEMPPAQAGAPLPPKAPAATPRAGAESPEPTLAETCDFVGAQSMGRIRDALTRCLEVTVTVDGRVYPYMRKAAQDAAPAAPPKRK